jgi:hypothetical protein
MSKWFRYRYHSPIDVSLDDGNSWEWDDEEIKSAGFDLNDEEISLCRLAQDWNGHPRGARVVTGLTVQGYPFAVEVK